MPRVTDEDVAEIRRLALQAHLVLNIPPDRAESVGFELWWCRRQEFMVSPPSDADSESAGTTTNPAVQVVVEKEAAHASAC